MNAVSGNMKIGEAAVKSVIAGADIILISTYNDSIEEISEALRKAVKEGVIPLQYIDDSVKRIIALKMRYRIMKYENGSASFNGNLNSSEFPGLSEKAGALNTEVSRRSIYFFSDKQGDITYKKSDTNIFVSTDTSFQHILEKEIDPDDYILFSKEKDCIKYLNKKTDENTNNGKNNKKAGSENGNIKIFYHFNMPDKQFLSSLLKFREKAGIDFCLLCTGNPFLLNELKSIPPSFFTFSNTDESYRQLLLCLKGEFQPLKDINVNLGFNKIKK